MFALSLLDQEELFMDVVKDQMITVSFCEIRQLYLCSEYAHRKVNRNKERVYY